MNARDKRGARADEGRHADMAIRRLDALDDRCVALLTTTNFVVLSTLSASGSPHASPTWVDTDGAHILLNTEGDRVWPRNLARDPRVACVVLNHENPYEYVSISGRALPAEEVGASEHADRLAKRYLGLDVYPHAGRSRVIIRIVPERVVHIYPPDGGVLDETLQGG